MMHLIAFGGLCIFGLAQFFAAMDAEKPKMALAWGIMFLLALASFLTIGAVEMVRAFKK